MLTKELLSKSYLVDRQSMTEIALNQNLSVHTVAYWMEKYDIKRRTRSEAMYFKHNPRGDPFKFRRPKTLSEAQLLGLGLGLYWGEGTKSNKHAVRLGNTDPKLIRLFMTFLIEFFEVQADDLRFGLQIFSDTNPQTALNFWVQELGVKASQFYKVTITRSGALGT